jgi:hypothetical protein
MILETFPDIFFGKKISRNDFGNISRNICSEIFPEMNLETCPEMHFRGNPLQSVASL